MECPNYVWDMIEAGTLNRDDVTESAETMRRNNCKYMFSEEEPFHPTNWFLFGIVTGFAVGAMVTRKGQPTMVITAHHGEAERCYYCNYRNKIQSECPCPYCVGHAKGEKYQKQVEVHGMAPPHIEGSEVANCKICQRNGWTEEEIQLRMEPGHDD